MTTTMPNASDPIARPSDGVLTRSWLYWFQSIAGLIGGLQVAAFAPGDIKETASSTIPNGWLLCNGAAVLRKGYPALYSAIGTTWGVGDGLTTFNLPDLRNRFMLGSGALMVGTKGGSSSVGVTAGSGVNIPGGGSPFVVNPPFAVVQRIIKT